MANEDLIIESLKDLDEVQMTILFWKMRGLNDELIGRKFKNGDAWTEDKMRDIYEKLGFPKEMHSKKKKQILYDDYLPWVKILTDDKEEHLAMWPLSAKPIEPAVDQIDQKRACGRPCRST